MAQINLLKQKSASQNIAQRLPGIISKLLIAALVLVLGFYVWTVLQMRSMDNQTIELQRQIAQAKSEVDGNENRNELLTRQEQLNEFNSLIDGHIYWSQIIPALADASLKSANFSNLKILDDGDLSLRVSVPSLAEMDKFLQIFDLPKFNKNFSNIRIGSFHKVPDKDKTVLSFEVRMKYNPVLIKYKENRF